MCKPREATISWLHLACVSRRWLQDRLRTWSRLQNKRLGGLHLKPLVKPLVKPYQTGPNCGWWLTTLSSTIDAQCNFAFFQLSCCRGNLIPSLNQGGVFGSMYSLPGDICQRTEPPPSNKGLAQSSHLLSIFNRWLVTRNQGGVWGVFPSMDYLQVGSCFGHRQDLQK